MRIPYDLMRDGLAGINQAAERMAAAQQQVSTGRRLNGAGDDPVAMQQATLVRSGLGAVDAYARSVDSAASALSWADATLSSFGDKLGAAIVAGLSARGNVSASSRAAAAESIRMLRDGLLSDINTSFNGRAIFSGTQPSPTAYAFVGGAWVYQGNADQMQVEVSKDRLVSVTFNGQELAQGTDTTDVFTVMDQLVTAINAGNNAAIGTALDGLQRAYDRANRVQGRLGADERGLDDAALRLSTLRLAGEARRSKFEDANMAEAITKLTDAQTAYKAALGSVSSTERLSLLDYLR